MMSSSTPSFTPGGLHNGPSNDTHDDISETFNEHWQIQLQKAAEHRQSSSVSHRHCKKDTASRSSRGNPTSSAEESQKNGDLIERHHSIINLDYQRQDWDGLDMSGQGIRNLSPSLFHNYEFLDKLFIDSNKLTSLPHEIGQLRNLSILDASNNHLTELPETIGMLVNLKELLVFDNNITTLPCEIGYLYRLDLLGIEGNPLDEDLKDMIVSHGTKALVVHIRDNTEGTPPKYPNVLVDLRSTGHCSMLTDAGGPPPTEREMVIIDDSEASEKFSVLDFNVLCDTTSNTGLYGYTPSRALSWDYRRELILEEIRKRDADVVCLQEVNMESYSDFRAELAYQHYKGVFWPRSRARTMAEKEARLVDGCATFFKSQKFILLDKQVIDFANIAINRPDMKGEHDIFNRVMPRDHIAVVTYFENRVTGSRMIVANAHTFWDAAFADVKVVQVAIMMEQITRLADKWSKFPPCTDKRVFRHTEQDNDIDQEIPDESPIDFGPSLEYSTGSQIPLVICADLNSEKHSGVYDLLDRGSLSGDHPDLANRGYGNFTRDGMAHPFSLKSAYSDQLEFTNYTPGFSGVIEYIWHSSPSLKVRQILGEVDHSYLQKVPGFPHFHFPSDHLPLFAEFSMEPRKAPPKVVEADFGPQRDR